MKKNIKKCCSSPILFLGLVVKSPIKLFCREWIPSAYPFRVQSRMNESELVAHFIDPDLRQ